MSDTQSMEEVASDVAERLRSKIAHTTHSSYPWLFVPADEVPVGGALRNVKLLDLVNLRSLILSYQCLSAKSSLARAAVYGVIDATISMFS